MDDDTPALNADGSLKEAHEIQWLHSTSDKVKHAPELATLRDNTLSSTPRTGSIKDNGQIFMYNPQQGTFNEAGTRRHITLQPFMGMSGLLQLLHTALWSMVKRRIHGRSSPGIYIEDELATSPDGGEVNILAWWKVDYCSYIALIFLVLT
jgi:hypothetical protein